MSGRSVVTSGNCVRYMSHIVEMSYMNGPSLGQNGDSSGAEHGLIREW